MNHIQEFQADEKHKQRNLWLGILFDVLGMVSFTIPVIGEFEDVVWAPVSGLLLAWMYKGKAGRIGGVFSFLEEIFPFTDVIPTFTLMWFYTYYWKKK
ncbi:MAG TPA: hypothetical protein VK623_09120 [Flavobacterium sp.]|nr:hypothetical protein [Flavobacterium sp.]